VLGLGLNVRMPAAYAVAIDQPWIDLATLSAAPPSRNALAAALLAQLLPALERFDRDGLAPFLPRYAELDGLAGRRVTLQQPAGTLSGIAQGDAADGALRVRLDDGRERMFHSGEVSVKARREGT
jgi:BirA family biotin operon repressor/biotin-[acetyl-CoA-carboxylase] ligase